MRLIIASTFLMQGIIAITSAHDVIAFYHLSVLPSTVAQYVAVLIGIMDFMVLVSILIRPYRMVLVWTLFWGLLTSIVAFLSATPLVLFLQSLPGWLAPLALLLLRGWPRKWKEMLSV